MPTLFLYDRRGELNSIVGDSRDSSAVLGCLQSAGWKVVVMNGPKVFTYEPGEYKTEEELSTLKEKIERVLEDSA